MSFPLPTVPEFGYTLVSLRELPTLTTGHFDNLKFDRGGYRVWLSRCGKADGLPYDNQVTIERLTSDGRWVEAHTHECKPRDEYGLLAMLYQGGYKPLKHRGGWREA